MSPTVLKCISARVVFGLHRNLASFVFALRLCLCRFDNVSRSKTCVLAYGWSGNCSRNPLHSVSGSHTAGKKIKIDNRYNFWMTFLLMLLILENQCTILYKLFVSVDLICISQIAGWTIILYTFLFSSCHCSFLV